MKVYFSFPDKKALSG